MASVLLVGTAGYGFGAAPSAPKEPDKASPSLEAVMGKRLVSIDGSIISLSLSEEGLVRQITAANGAIQKTAFTFISERLGTVADSADTNKIVAVFRATETALEIEFADGTSELLLANSFGGISIESTSAVKDTYCTTWYPDGHVFSVDERKAALAQYAMRLGLGDSAQKTAATGAPCGSAPVRLIEAAAPKDVAKTEAKADATKYDAAKADPAPTPSAAPPAPAGTRGRRGAALRPVAPKQTVLAEIKPVEVRNSEIHPVPEDVAPASPPDTAAKQVVAALDTPAQTTPGAAPAAAYDAAKAAPATPPSAPDAKAPDYKPEAKAPDYKPADSKAPETKAPQVVASLEKPPAVTAAPPAKTDQKGASSCLSIESDGSHWGFRNHCGYTVQFAYCQMNGVGQPASCKDGTVPGSVSPNGFGALVADQSLKESDVEHDFRWVACQGGAGEVIPRLEQTEPPVGRCVR
ncbi:MAG TPA: hypothetical protein VEU06_08950 [Micropepsaceae bacterium]|nr:hypothetical protein [Micropepsaceae bacterium]